MLDNLYIEPRNEDSLTQRPDPLPNQKHEFGDLDAPTKGRLLEYEEAKAAALNAELYFRKQPMMSLNIATWEVNELRRRGVAGVSVRQSKSDVWEPYIPPDASPDDIPGPNMAARICRRMESIIFSDPPAPDPEPEVGDDDTAEAAELSRHMLMDLDSEAQLNDLAAQRRAFSRAMSFGSGFVHYRVNPRGGGYKPITVQAHPQSTSFDDALDHPVMQPALDDFGQPMLDPATMQPQQQPAISADGQPVREDWPEDELKERFVRWDGSLTDDLTEKEPDPDAETEVEEEGEPPTRPAVAHRWVPKLERKVLTGRQVRFIPHNCEDIWDAHGVQICEFLTWGEVKRQWPKFEELDSSDKGRTERDALFNWSPSEGNLKDLVDISQRDLIGRDFEDVDERLVPVMTTYYKSGSEYAKGCWFIALADKLVAFRDDWCWEKENGEEESLELPLTQQCQFSEGDDNPYRHGLMEILGRTNEARLATWDSFLRHIEKMEHQVMTVAHSSPVTAEYNTLPYGTLVRVPPGSEGHWAPIDAYPPEGFNFFELFGREMQSDSGLEQAAMGVEDPSVKSGVHAYAIIGQATASLSELYENAKRAVQRSWRIKLQLVGAFYDVPQKLQYTGEDKEFQVTSWIGQDFTSIRKVNIAAGTFTMQSQPAKAQIAERMLATRVITQDRYNKIVRENMGGLLGLEEDDHSVRIRRQLSQFKLGPGKDQQPTQQPAPPMVDPATGAQVPQIDPATGQPAMQMILPPELLAIWEPVPADSLPDVAQVRLRELADFCAKKAYQELPPWWRIPFEQEFGRMYQVVSMIGQPMRSEQGPAQGQQQTPGGQEGEKEKSEGRAESEIAQAKAKAGV